MARDILSEYGSDSPTSEAPRASSGGAQSPKPIPYSPPKGPIGQSNTGPGLGGTNHGCCGTQGKH